MCRKVAWAELAVEVTFMVLVQNGAPEYKKDEKRGVFQAFLLYRIRVSEGVTNIAASAFDHCCSLECVTLPASVKELGEWAFFMSSG